jgi:para-aminobenzoate synthetase component 1
MGRLAQLPQIKDLFTREISLSLPFETAAARFAHRPGTVLLLSGSDMDCARYNCLAVNPWLELKGGRNGLNLKVDKEDVDPTCICPSQDPFDLVQALLTECVSGTLSTDLPVAAGLFGYFSYDLKDIIEDLPRTCVDTRLPDIALYAPSVLLVQDRVADKTYISIPVFDRPDAAQWVAEQETAFLAELDCPWASDGFSIDCRGFTSSFTKPEYIASVSRIIDYLKAGDIYQANLSQRFETGFSGDAYGLFLELFNRNPASFFSFINASDHYVVSTSPERFIKLEGRDVETRPIKGTIARGKTPEADEENGKELAASLKDDAELTMIVDLMRNDISRVTENGSVEVTEHKRLEPYENVFHLVSVVRGRLQEGKTAVDLIRATFPGGSITGCPKIRAMEIIDELEPVKRHVYTGSIGYISFHNTMDLSIAIRTATISDNRLFFSVGGGIVYDSDPEKEFQETLDKGKTLMETLLGASAGKAQAHLKAWVNGKLTDQDRAQVPVLSKGVQYGAGLFETIRVEKGRPLFLEAHVNRMNGAWAELFHTEPPDITWGTVIDILVRENRLQDQTCAVKLMAARDESREQVFLASFIRPYVHRLKALNKSGLDLVTFPKPRQTYLADHKTLNYLYYERAADYAKAEGADEAIILNTNGSVSETNTCNIIAVQGNTLILPESAHVLPGVTQAAVTAAMTGKGYAIRYEQMTPEALASYPNVLVTNALMGAVPVDYINGIAIRHDPAICNLVNDALIGVQ